MTDINTFEINRENYDSFNEENLVYKAPAGLDESVVREISKTKNEPQWMLDIRLRGLKLFQTLPMPRWGPDLSKLDLDAIHYFMRPDAKNNATSWDEVPKDIKDTFDRLGIPKAEHQALAGVGAQYESEVVYHKIKSDLAAKGVIFLDCDQAVKQFPEMVKKYFMTSCVPIGLHKFSALHAACWSGGTFIYVPPGVKVDLPLQAYFRMNAQAGGQFEHTLIIADENSEIFYLEGCSAPLYKKTSLHAGCVEIHALPGSRVRYSSVENWSKNTYNLNTKRAVVHKDAIIEWVNGNLGCLTGDSKVFTSKDGPKNIIAIQKGESILAWDEKTKSIKSAKVKAMIYSGEKEVFNIKVAGRELQASANHPFLSLNYLKKNEHKKGFFSYTWKRLDELKAGDIIAISKKIPIEGKPYELTSHKNEMVSSKNQYASFQIKTDHLYNNIKIPKRTTPEFMWFLGLMMGDGHVDVKRNKINLATHVLEDYRDYLCTLLHTLFSYTVTEKKERYIIINSRTICQFLKEIGLVGTAISKRIPNWVYSLPEDQIKAFLAGYIDSDGHVESGGLYVTSINKPLLEDIKTLAIHCGLGVSYVFNHGKAKKTTILGVNCNAKDSYRILFNTQDVKSIPLRCKRKYNKLLLVKTTRNHSTAKGLHFSSKTTTEFGFAKIDEIQSQGIKPTFDIEVEKYHNFIANGIIVHNSGVTMLYPTSILLGEKAKSNFIGIAYAGKDQHQDTGCKVVHVGKHTSSTIISKSISKNGGITSYRGLVSIKKGAVGAASSVECDALMIDSISQSNTYPYMDVHEEQVDLAHEATVGKISDEQKFYLMSRGLDEEAATQMIVSGFIEPVTKALPLEYAVELNRLIELEMEGNLG